MTATTELIERALTLVRERPGMAESVSQVILELVDAVPVSATAVQQPNRDAVVKAIRSARWPDGSIDGFPSTRVSEMIADAVLVALAVPATGETATQYRAVWPGGSVSMPLPHISLVEWPSEDQKARKWAEVEPEILAEIDRAALGGGDQ